MEVESLIREENAPPVELPLALPPQPYARGECTLGCPCWSVFSLPLLLLFTLSYPLLLHDLLRLQIIV